MRVLHEALIPYGLTDRFLALFADVAGETATLGRVIRQDRGFAVVVTDDGTVTAATPSRKAGTIVVAGDWVCIEDETVTQVLERTSTLRRGVASRDDPTSVAEQPLVANMDVVFVVCGADRPRSSGRIERVVAQAWDANATPVIVLTKSDLLDDVDAAVVELNAEVPMVDVVVVSSVSGDRVEELRAMTLGKTVTMIGESGAGKSTLLNALLGEDIGAVGEVREADGRGRHTTVRRELHLIPTGGVLVDTPGLRSMGLWTDEKSVDAAFSDIAEIAESCRFSNCVHDSEPGCAVQAAVDAGTITKARFESWRSLRKEAVALELRSKPAERHRMERNFGRAVVEALELKGNADERNRR